MYTTRYYAPRTLPTNLYASYRGEKKDHTIDSLPEKKKWLFYDWMKLNQILWNFISIFIDSDQIRMIW